MIGISSAMQQEEIKTLLEGYEGEDFSYTFKAKKGIQLQFEVSGDPEAAAKKAKALIKEQAWGSILYFQAIAI
ncbi:MAG TPA: hypothetical protein H9829_03290 [Candidatus Tetragenococcus pullicola]|nr:hypothetical protein [Candidatus Tetragenococcus pullicola]